MRAWLSVRPVALAAGLALVPAACGDGGDGGDAGAPREPSEELVAQVASYDVAAGRTRRFIVGLLTADNAFVTGGRATMRFFFLGEQENEFVSEAEAMFIALPGEDPAHEHEHAHAGAASEGRGVYAAYDVAFDRPGPWQVEITVTVEDEERTGTAAFQVLDEAEVPDVGDPALRTRNLTVDDAGEAPPGAIDSRAETEREIPDPELHETTIADAVKAGRPVVAVFSTPVYCISQFCGPVTDMVAGLQADYGDRADFVHVEIWRDHQNQVINRAAADWLLPQVNEPWVFLINARGIVEARWDNVATRAEIEPVLENLPPLESR